MPSVASQPFSRGVRRRLIGLYRRTRWFEPLARYCRKRLLNDRFLVKLGREPDWANPQRFTDKVQWMKWRGELHRLAPLVDKLEVKTIVGKHLGSEHVLPAIATWRSPEEFRASDAPPNSILKATHSSGANLPLPALLDCASVEKAVTRWFKKDYELAHLEPQYRGLRPKVIAEPLLDLEAGTVFDFKFFCFDGDIAAIQAIGYEPTVTNRFYDLAWRRLPISRADIPDRSTDVPRPWCLDELIDATRLLSRDFPFVRLDWMVTGSSWYFGEFTFCPTNGWIRFEPDEIDFDWGSRLQLRPYVNPFGSVES